MYIPSNINFSRGNSARSFMKMILVTALNKSRNNVIRKAMAGLSSFQITFYYYYFLLHIPITLLIDSAVIVPSKFHVAAWLVSKQVEENNDFLLYDKPLWLQVFVMLEMAIQLPLFFRFIGQLRINHVDSGSLKFYGISASTTTLVCIGAILEGHYPGTTVALNVSDKLKLVTIYFPTFIIPFRLILL